MRRRIPSTTMLLAFEAAARSQSFTQAGRDLSLTQSAISHQILALEEFLAVKLFERVRQRLRLTSAGHLLYSRLSPALNTLEGAILETMASQRSGSSLQIGVAPTFASKWLIPRLPRFAARHPTISLGLVSRVDSFNFDEEAVDAAVQFGTPGLPGLQFDFLVHEEAVVVCSPEMAPALRGPADLATVPLLRLASRLGAWAEWAGHAGVEGLDVRSGPQFELFSMVAQAAAAGLGAAVLPRFFILDELSTGRLTVPFGPSFVSPTHAYYLARPDARAELAAVLHFRQWMLEEARDTH